MDKKQILGIIRSLSFFAVGAILLFLAFRGQDFEALKQNFKIANYWWLLIPKFFSTLAHFTRALRWNLLIAPLGYNPGSLNTFYAVMIGYFTNMAVPRMGEVMRCWSLKKTENIPVDKLLGTVIVERTIDTLSLLVLIGLVVLIKINLLQEFFMDKVFSPIGEKLSSILPGGMIIFLLIAIFTVLTLGFYLMVKKKGIAGIPIIGKLANIAEGLIEGLKAVFRMKKKFRFLLYTIFIWTMYFFGFYTCFLALEVTKNVSTFDGLFVFTSSGLGMAAPVQAGIGAFHWIVMEAFKVIGIQESDGLVMATLIHGSSILYMLVVGGISLAIVMWNNKKKNE